MTQPEGSGSHLPADNSSSSAPVTAPIGSASDSGSSTDTPKRKVPTWVWIVGGVVVFGLILSVFSGDDDGVEGEAGLSPDLSVVVDDEATETNVDDGDAVIDEEVPEPEAGFGDGTYIVGDTIEPGIYRSTATDLCYWERMSGFGGTFDEIIANGNEGTIVDIAESDAGFKTERCGQWLPLADTYPAAPATEFGDGTYEVGTHIEPGRYSNSGGENCYYERKSGFTQTFDDIIANDFGSTTAVVEIQESDRGFTARGCGTWTLSG